MADALVLFGKQMQLAGLSDGTRDRYQCAMRSLAEHTGEEPRGAHGEGPAQGRRARRAGVPALPEERPRALRRLPQRRVRRGEVLLHAHREADVEDLDARARRAVVRAPRRPRSRRGAPCHPRDLALPQPGLLPTRPGRADSTSPSRDGGALPPSIESRISNGSPHIARGSSECSMNDARRSGQPLSRLSS